MQTLPIRLKECKGVDGVVLVARSQVAASFTSWQFVRVETAPGAPLAFKFSGRAEINQYWATEHPDVIKLQIPGKAWTWSGVTFEFGDGTVRCTLIGPPEEEQ